MALDPLKVIGLFVPRLRILWESRNEFAAALERAERQLGFFQGEYRAATEAVEDLRQAMQRQLLRNDELDVHIRQQEEVILQREGEILQQKEEVLQQKEEVLQQKEEILRQAEVILQLREQGNDTQAKDASDTLLALHETIQLLTSQRDKIWQQFVVLSARNTQLAAAIAAANEAAQLGKTGHEEAERLRLVVAKLENALAEHQSELAELRQQRQDHEELKTAFSVLQSDQAEAKQQHSTELEALATERDSLLVALTVARKSIADTNQRRDEMLQEHDTVLGDRLRLQGEIEKLQAEHTATIASLRDRLDRSQSDFKALFNRVLKAENEAADQQTVAARAEVATYQSAFGDTAVRKRAFLHIGSVMPAHPLWQHIQIGPGHADGGGSDSAVWEPDYPEALTVPERAIHLAYIGWQLALCDDQAIVTLLKNVALTLREEARIRLVVPDGRLVISNLLNGNLRRLGENAAGDAPSLGEALALAYRWKPASEMRGSNVTRIADAQLRQDLSNWLENADATLPWTYGKTGPNLLTEIRLRKFLSGAGFTNISRSAYQQSESNFLRDPSYFDAESPSLSLFMEATRNTAPTSAASRKPGASRLKADR